MKNINEQKPIATVNIAGAGLQHEDEASVVNYMPMPAVMETYATPVIPEPEQMQEGCAAALSLLTKVEHALIHHGGDAHSKFSLVALNKASLDFVNQLLGAGEVSISIDGSAPLEIQESVMTGVWRVRQRNASDQLIDDYLEVAAIPQVVLQRAFQAAKTGVDTSIFNLPEGTVNAPALLAEIDEKMRQLRPDREPHVLNLTLLPLSPQDLMLLGERLGVGPVTILSRGYGNCRIGSTGCQSVWWIKYYNSEDTLIMNTIEIVKVPEVALAAAEDLNDSAERLSDILGLYR